MSFATIGRSLSGWATGARRRGGVWWAVEPRGSGANPRLSIYIYQDVADAMGWTRGTRVMLHVGTHRDAGLIYVTRATDERRALILGCENNGAKRFRISRTMDCWMLPALPQRKAREMAEWRMAEFGGEPALMLRMTGKDAEELRHAQECAAAQSDQCTEKRGRA